MSPQPSILLLDDDSGVRRTLGRYLQSKDYTVVEAEDLRSALALVQSAHPDAAILDYMLPDGTALELMPKIRAEDPDLPVAVLTGHGTIELAVRAVKEGAEHFLTKPVELAALAVIVERMLKTRRERQKTVAAQRRIRSTPDPFLGISPAIRNLREKAEKLAASQSPVLILGETGSGKGVLARWLHDNGPRCNEAFVDMNCSSLSRELLESELFGHEKGAFTGAFTAKKGLVEIAHRGTLFLDEIADMALDVQPRLLTVLEDMRYRRLGDVRDRSVDLRLIAATHQDMPELVKGKRFRADLFYRISALPMHIPPLRERTEDIPILAGRLLDSLSVERGGRGIHLSTSAIDRLKRYSWPGNIRELRNVLERATLLSDHDELDAPDFQFDRSGADGRDVPTHLTLKELERIHIQRVLEEEHGRVQTAAERLGIPRSTLYQKLKSFEE